ncbi:MAG: hypothetical protein QXW71_00915 [Thermoplasmata archaeon]
MLVCYLDKTTTIPFYFHKQGRVLLDSSCQGSVSIFKLWPTIQEVNVPLPNLVFDTDYNTYVFRYHFPSSSFQEGSYLIKATLIKDNFPYTSQRLINLKSSNVDLSLFDLFEISKFIFSEDLEDIDVDRLILVFQTILDYVETYLGRKVQLSKVTDTLPSNYVISHKNKIQLSTYPLVSVERVYYFDDPNQTLDYQILDAKFSTIIITSPVRSNQYIKIEYTAGYYPIPEGLLSTIYEMTGVVYDRVKYWNFDRINVSSINILLSKDFLNYYQGVLNKYKRVI